MGDTGTGERARRAGRSVYTASQTAARAGAAAASGASRAVHRMTRASGAGRTGLSNLIELTAAGSVGDAFVAVALAGSLFFSVSVDQARSRVAIALLVTIAPYAILAPVIGPLLDRVRQGNRYILMGTLLARGLLCWGMASAVEHKDAVTLLPAAFGVLVLQKAYGVTRAAVTPRLLPSEITLVTANARSNLASLIATSAGALVALGLDTATGGHGGGAAWVLRAGTVVYLAATAMAMRLPDRVDVTEDAHSAPSSAAQPGQGPQPGAVPYLGAASGSAHPDAAELNGSTRNGSDRRSYPATVPLPDASGRRHRRFTIPALGPVVGEAMRANAAIRMFYGFMIFFLAFILRSERFGHTSDKVALVGLAAVIAAGGMIGTGIGSALRARSPQIMMFVVLALATIAATTCAVLFSLWSVLAVALAAAISQTLVKVALDSILQREIPEETRSSTFAFSETVHQLALVGGGLIGLLLSLTGSGFAGLTVAAIGLAVALCSLLLARRRRILRSHPAARPVS
ncbi:MAG: MFS transporter [Streptosporangiaceae bacterium]